MNQHNLWCFVNRKKNRQKRLRGKNLPHHPCYKASDRLAISWWYPQPFFWAPEPLCCLWHPKRMLTFCAESSEKHPWFSVKKQRRFFGREKRGDWSENLAEVMDATSLPEPGSNPVNLAYFVFFQRILNFGQSFPWNDK